MKKPTGYLLLMLSSILLIQSCNSYKNIAYFKDVPDSTRLSVSNPNYNPLLIHKGDILSITIQTIDPEANAIFNQLPVNNPMSQISGATTNTSGAAAAINPASTMSGYQVNDDDDIELPMLGKIKVGGLTTSVAADTIKGRVALLYKMPVVAVRFANLKINVMGEVMRPGTYPLTVEKSTILDALAMAGDLTIFGKRENALLIRDSAGQSNFIRFSLNSKDLVKQDFFYLKPNDVIYIEPGPSKAASLDAVRTRNIAIGASVISLLIIIATRIK